MDKTVTVTIDDREVAVAEGTPLIEAAASAGIRIPHLCYCPGIKSVGACRLCVVELEGSRNLVASCARLSKDGMIIRTDTPRVEAARRFVVDLLLSNHPKECLSCDKSGSCGLQDAAYSLGIPKTSYPMKDPGYPVDESNPFIVRDYNLCVLCGLCIRVCEYQSEGILSFMSRGMGTKVGTAGDLPLQESGCDFCGSCVSVCPTAALMEKDRRARGREWEIAKVASVCGYCSCGCETVLNHVDGRVVRVDSPEPAEFLCARGRFGFDAFEHQDRLRKPLVRKEGQLVECGWDEALEAAASGLRGVAASAGGDSVGFVVGTGATCEVALAVSEIAKSMPEAANFAISARPSEFTTLSRIIGSMGSLSAVATSEDIKAARVIVVAGADVTADYPAINAWISRARERGAKLLVVDARSTGIARRADIHLRPGPGRESMVLLRIAARLLDSGGRVAEQGLEGAGEMEARLADSLGVSAADIGVSGDETATAALLIAEAAGAVAFVVPADAPDPSLLAGVIDLALLSGCTDGCVVPATITSNVRGHFELFGDGGRTSQDVLASEKTKALFVWDDDPLGRHDAGADVARRIASLDLLVVATAFMSETARNADVVLPLASVTETQGTRVNLEGRLRRQRCITANGVMGDLEVLSRLAASIGSPLPWRSADECEAAVEALLGARGTAVSEAEPPRRFALDVEPLPLPETSPDRPMVVTGGTVFHFDHALVTRHSVLSTLEADDGFFGMNRDDMDALDLTDGSTVVLTSGAEDLEVTVRALDSLPSGMAFVPRWSETARFLFGKTPHDEAGTPHRTVRVRPVCSGVAQGGQ